MIRLIVDAMGGDNAPDAIIDGCLMALEQLPELAITAVGQESEILRCLEGKTYDAERFDMVHAPDVITNEEKPVMAIKKKKESSLVVALNMVAEGKGDGFVSAGSTGAVLAGATLIIKRLDGILRPALAPSMPTATDSQVLLIDCGANVDCKPEYLAQFAVMGSAYMQAVVGVENPRVAMINNGAEEGKGNELAKATFPLLKEMPVHFVGNVEGRDILSGDVDVAVADGFVGNAVLKSIEGTGGLIFDLLKTQMKSSLRNKIGAAILMPAFRVLKKKMDYTEYGGAPMLGLREAVVKAHGSSNAKAYCSALKQAYGMCEKGVVKLIQDKLSGITPEL